MFNLPASTEFNRTIPKDKLFTQAITKSSLREIFDEQIEKIIWRNKLSKDTYPDFVSFSGSSELEIFEIIPYTRSIDKRVLRQIDRNIPYYILHIVSSNSRYQALIAQKKILGGKVNIMNYSRSAWLDESELSFSFSGKTPESVYNSLKEQVESKRKIYVQQQFEECNAFMHYFSTMKMTRSYKPVLILATIEAGGIISLDRAAKYFIKFYRYRVKNGLPAEKGSCIYADKADDLKAIYSNLVTNPIAALCGSGFFKYDKKSKNFSFADDIYDGLTLYDIDQIIETCNERLKAYYRSI